MILVSWDVLLHSWVTLFHCCGILKAEGCVAAFLGHIIPLLWNTQSPRPEVSISYEEFLDLLFCMANGWSVSLVHFGSFHFSLVSEGQVITQNMRQVYGGVDV